MQYRIPSDAHLDSVCPLLITFDPKKTRLLGTGLCIHIALDSIDCQVTNGIWYYREVAEELAFMW